MSGRTVVVALALMLLGVGCASDDRASTSADSDSVGGGGGASGGVVANQANQLASQPVGEGREVVYTGDVVVLVSSLADATDEAAAVAAAHDGFVFSQHTDDDATEMTVKVPSDEFTDTLTDMAALGKELRRSLSAEDVTAEVVDVEGRLKTAHASADRLRALLGEAGSAADVVAVEAELAKRESEIESLQGRLRVLEDQVALATLTVRLTKRNDVEVADDLPGFMGGLRAGVVALLNAAQVLLVLVGFLLPFVPIAVVTAWAVRRWLRRRRVGHRAAHGPPPRGPGPQPSA